MGKQILYFNFEEKIYELQLPAINNRRFNLNLANSTIDRAGIVPLEVWDDEWFMRENDDITISVDGYRHNLVHLKDGLMFQLRLNRTNELISIMVIEQTSEITEFCKYHISRDCIIHIGQDENSEIVIHDEFVSRNHAKIEFRGNGYILKDCSRNGTFLNGQRVSNLVDLNPFDEIYIVGVKIIFLGNMIAVNHRDIAKVNLRSVEVENDFYKHPSMHLFDSVSDTFFSRSPRIMEPLDDTSVEIEAPPSNHKNKQQPLLFVLGPSVTMPLPIMLSVLFNVYMNSSKSNPLMYLGTLISVLSSALVGAIWAFAHRKYNAKMEREAEDARVKGYKNYIEQNCTFLAAKHQCNKAILENQFASTHALIQFPENNLSMIWNRNINHADFLTIRIGTGRIEYPGKITIPKDRFSLTEDALTALPEEVFQKYRYMDDAVSTISLGQHKLVGVVGNHYHVMEIACSMAVQIAALHCYTDVKMACITGDHDSEYMKWMKWLPHCFSSDRKIRYIANDSQSTQNVLFELTSILREREEQGKEDKGYAQTPHYVVFCTEKELLENEAIYSYMVSQKNLGFTFVLLYDSIDRLPNECMEVMTWDDDFSGVLALDKSRKEALPIVFDTIQTEEAEHFAKALCGIHVHESAGGEIPNYIDFMELYQIANLNQWDLMRHYKENRAYEGIQAMIGQTFGNKPMFLDIHEKKHGPHGLVAGTTGSGKSETIMTFILSLAMNYHPDEVAFVLIDYKGGGMAAPFIGLPHTAGTITNIGNGDENESIDPNQTRRALISIKSEIHRRQKLFNKYKVNHIDAYIRLYRDGQTEEALPHLIIISDEFAELRKEQPEFIKELISAARVGRSLGIHLILATQKPAGVVDDEIWSNSRFKICLRVQDKQDSMGMLKRPEAASLTGTGRGYIQIGNDEIFEQFQSGYAGAEYQPKEKVELSQHSEVSMIGIDGSKLVSPKKQRRTGGVSQIDACISYIKKVANENDIRGAKPLWLPALPEILYLEDIHEDYYVSTTDGLTAVYGLIDQPELQKQFPAVINFYDIANLLIVGNIGMGKSTLLQTLLYSLVSRYSSTDVSIYCMDFSSRTFKIFQELPHCGGVAFSDEEETVSRMLSLINRTIEERRSLFEKAGVGSFQEYLTIQKIPLVLLCIDNYSLFKELYSDYEDRLTVFLREGSKYGIQIITTANSVGDITYRIRQYFSAIIPLYLGEKGKYADALGISPDFMPANHKGRGLLVRDGLVEFHTALAVKASNELERNRILLEQFHQMSELGGDNCVTKIRTIPKDESYVEFAEKYQTNNLLPIGYNVESIEPEYIRLTDLFCYLISGVERKSIELFNNNIEDYCKLMNIRCDRLLSGAANEPGYVSITSYDNLLEWAMDIRNDFASRSRFVKELGSDKDPNEILDEITNRYGKRFVLIENLADFIEVAYEETIDQETIAPLMEVLLKQGKGFGIYFVANIDYATRSIAKTKRLYTQFMEYRMGIHLGGKLDQQRLYDYDMPYSKQAQVLDVNHGSYMENGTYKQIYVPFREVK